jgi:hypothetical protein
MAARTLLTTTRMSAVRPLIYQGTSVYGMYKQIIRLIETKLSSEHAAIFAEPVQDPSNSSIDWYSSVSGDVRIISELSPELQIAAKEKAGVFASEIKSLADILHGEKEPHRKSMACLLDLSLQFPDDENLYVIGDMPVITCWGFAPGDRDREPQVLSRLTNVTAPKEEAEAITRLAQDRPKKNTETSSENRSFKLPHIYWKAPWLPWVAAFFLGTLLALFLLWLWDRYNPAMLAWRDEQMQTYSLDIETRRGNVLQESLLQLRQQAQDARQLCVPVTSQEFDRRAKGCGSDGDLVISLGWNNRNDLDLYVLDPEGREVSPVFSDSGPNWESCKDLNTSGDKTDPIERIFWRKNIGIPKGIYKIFVRYYKQYDTTNRTPFTLEVRNMNDIVLKTLGNISNPYNESGFNDDMKKGLMPKSVEGEKVLFLGEFVF